MSEVPTTEVKRVGGWALRRALGHGGNADVYAAVRDGMAAELALKVLRATKVDKEPYQRFVREVGVLGSIGDFPGVLPLAEAHLPDEPSRRDPAWLAMPMATPIRVALTDAPLDVVVGATREIAGTLVRLKQAHHIAHRDIKPGNLYELDGQWLVGDFGLVAVPDVEQLTKEGKQLGPAHYTAHEMILDPVHADPFAADVYSLAKTLWVLATGQNYPPDGHQQRGTRGYTISELRPHPHAEALDRLVDMATLIHPEKRPTMEQFAADLEAWAHLGSGASALEVTGLGLQVRAKMKQQLEQEDSQEHLKDLAVESVGLLQDLLRPLQETFKEVHPRPEFNLVTEGLMKNVLLSPSPFSTNVVFKWYTYDRLAAGDAQLAYSLRFGRSLEVLADGVLVFRWHIQVGREGVSGAHSWQQERPARAKVGSIEAEQMLREGVEELKEPLELALRTFTDELPAR